MSPQKNAYILHNINLIYEYVRVSVNIFIYIDICALLLQYYSVLLAAVTVAAPQALRMKKNPHEKDCECSCIQHT